MKPLYYQVLAPLLALVGPISASAAHVHLTAGVDETGTRLVLLDENGDALPPVGRGYNVITWDPRGEFSSGGTLQLDWEYAEGQDIRDLIAFIAQSSEGNDLMPPGSQIWMTMDLIAAPEGGEFAFWEPNTTDPAHLFPADGSGGSYAFILSEWESGVVDAEQDPDGHIDGRNFTGLVAGDYYVQFSLYDSQGLLDPSEDYTFHFVAVPEPGTLSLALVALAVFGSRRRN